VSPLVSSVTGSTESQLGFGVIDGGIANACKRCNDCEGGIAGMNYVE
jgi:hypothetical protein